MAARPPVSVVVKNSPVTTAAAMPSSTPPRVSRVFWAEPGEVSGASEGGPDGGADRETGGGSGWGCAAAAVLGGGGALRGGELADPVLGWGAADPAGVRGVGATGAVGA